MPDLFKSKQTITPLPLASLESSIEPLGYCQLFQSASEIIWRTTKWSDRGVMKGSFSNPSYSSEYSRLRIGIRSFVFPKGIENRFSCLLHQKIFLPTLHNFFIVPLRTEAVADCHPAKSGHSPACSGRLLITVNIPPTALRGSSKITSAKHSDKWLWFPVK